MVRQRRDRTHNLSLVLHATSYATASFFFCVNCSNHKVTTMHLGYLLGVLHTCMTQKKNNRLHGSYGQGFSRNGYINRLISLKIVKLIIGIFGKLYTYCLIKINGYNKHNSVTKFTLSHFKEWVLFIVTIFTVYTSSLMVVSVCTYTAALSSCITTRSFPHGGLPAFQLAAFSKLAFGTHCLYAVWHLPLSIVFKIYFQSG